MNFLKLFGLKNNDNIIPPKPKFLTYGRSKHWKDLRNEFIKENDSKCAACGFKTNLEVHHIIPYHIDPTRELDKTNLIVLCENKSLYCHFVLAHNFDWMAYNPNIIEDAALLQRRIHERLYK